MAVGTENIKKTAFAILELGDIYGDVMEDGQVSISDLPQVIRIGAAGKELTDSVMKLAVEAIDLDNQESQKLMADIKVKVEELKADAGPDTAEEIAKSVLIAAIHIATVVSYVAGTIKTFPKGGLSFIY